MQQKKSRTSKKKTAETAPRIRLFTVRMHYLSYLLDESYKYYMDFQDTLLEDEVSSQIIFTSHFFNNHVDKTKIDSISKEVYQDNLNSILDDISSSIVKVSFQLKVDPIKLIKEFLATQTHIEEDERHVVTNLAGFLEKRVKATIQTHNMIQEGLKQGLLTQKDLADIVGK